MGLYDRDYMLSDGNAGRDPERKGSRLSGRKTAVIVMAIIMILIFVIAYVA